MMCTILMHLLQDEMGRPFPGNPSESENFYTVKCWDRNSVVVKVCAGF
jgi:hypothetical protein